MRGNIVEQSISYNLHMKELVVTYHLQNENKWNLCASFSYFVLNMDQFQNFHKIRISQVFGASCMKSSSECPQNMHYTRIERPLRIITTHYLKEISLLL